MSDLTASERAPGLLIGPGVELPDDVAIGGHVVIHGGTVIAHGCRIQDGAVVGKRRLVAPTAHSRAAEVEAPAVLERGAAVGCQAVIVAGARLGPGAVAGDHTLIREGVVLEAGAVIGSLSGVGPGCRIGEGSRLMPGALLALDTVVEDGVFCGPRLIVTNDPELGRLGPGARHPVTTLRRRCRVGANVTILPGMEIGEDALVAAGSLVTKNVPPRTVVMGAPARIVRELPAG